MFQLIYTVLSAFRGDNSENSLCPTVSFKKECCNGEYDAFSFSAVSYSPNKFLWFLKSEFFFDSFGPEIEFILQEKSENSIPDATITQGGFKINVETKLSDCFYSDQLIRHLQAFTDEKCKVMITLAPEPMAEDKLSKF